MNAILKTKSLKHLNLLCPHYSIVILMAFVPKKLRESTTQEDVRKRIREKALELNEILKALEQEETAKLQKLGELYAECSAIACYKTDSIWQDLSWASSNLQPKKIINGPTIVEFDDFYNLLQIVLDEAGRKSDGLLRALGIVETNYSGLKDSIQKWDANHEEVYKDVDSGKISKMVVDEYFGLIRNMRESRIKFYRSSLTLLDLLLPSF
jgi:hypothetical protein